MEENTTIPNSARVSCVCSFAKLLITLGKESCQNNAVNFVGIYLLIQCSFEKPATNNCISSIAA